MKKIAPIFLFGGLAVMTTASIVVGSLAWFSAKARITDTNDPIAAVTEGAYFAYGDGSAEKPFGITKPRHLYNLSWLQYLNHFNKKVDGTGKIIPTYFELGDDVIGEGMVIPPIGDATHPFVGNFDGNGHVISDFVITNNPSEFVVKPAAVSSYTPSEIVGLFGVVGKLESDATTSYDTSINAIYDTGISGLTIKSNTEHALAGIAAGYVNGPVTNVAVANSAIEIGYSDTAAISGIGTSNLSDYSILGYCTTNYKSTIKKVDETIYDINVTNVNPFVIQESGDTAGWGGSVNMLDMYTRLDTIWNKFNNSYVTGGIDSIQYPTTSTVDISKTGEVTTTYGGYTSNRMNGRENNYFVNNVSAYRRYFNYSETDSTDGLKTSSYGFIVEEGNTPANEEKYMCLTGNREVPITNGLTETTNYFDSYIGNHIFVTRNGTPCYLSANGTNDVTVVTNSSNASYWKYEDNQIYTSVNDNLYYLTIDDNDNVALSNEESDFEWLFDSTSKCFYINVQGTNYYLSTNGSDWLLNYKASDGTNPVVLYATKNGTKYYMTHTGTSGDVGTSSTLNSNCYWYRDGNYFTTELDGDIYIRSNSTDSGSLYFSNSTTNRYYMNGNYLYLTYTSGWISRTRYCYAYLNNNNLWRGSRATNQNGDKTEITIQEIEISPMVPVYDYTFENVDTSEVSPDPLYVKRTDVATKDSSFNINPTYFPLRHSDTQTGVPADTNTGYVISGANYRTDPYGDIRVSKFNRSDLSNSYSDGQLSTVYTVDASLSKTTIPETGHGLVRYDDAKAAMETLLDENSNIYGLHFMNAAISYGGTRPVICPKAVVNGNTYYNLEFPSDCIDFHLKEKGYINFFAGTYYQNSTYGNNDSFFSLNEIFRNGNSIQTVKEIIGVYADLTDTAEIKSYLYQYSDNTYSIPYKYVNGEKKNLDGSTYVENQTSATKPSEYSLVFNTARIKKQSNITLNAAYFFEIPMNEGEFCLGSVSGANGAYLMYLDIAANASKIQRTTVCEHFVREEYTYQYPLGVTFSTVSGVSSAATTTVDPLLSGFVTINADQSGTILVNQTDANNIAVSKSTDSSTILDAECAYHNDSIAVKQGSTALDDAPTSSETKDVKRMTYYDYDAVNDKITKTIITDTTTSVNGAAAATTRTVVQYDNAGAEVTEKKVYDDSGRLITDYSSINIGSATTTVIIKIHCIVPNGATFEDEVVLNMKRETGQLYFNYDDYTFEITVTGGTATITVVTLGSKKIMINDTQITQQGQTITIPTA